MSSAAVQDPAAEVADGPREPWTRTATRWVVEHAIFAMLLVFIVVFAILSPVFGSLGNAEVILLAASTAALLALGQTFVILTGGIDLSVGSVVGLSGVVSALVVPHGVVLAVVCGVGSGLLVGLVNGTAVSAGRVPPFVVTLGMMTIALGLAQVISDGSPISGLPDGFLAIANNSWLGIPIPIILMVVAFAVLWLVLGRTRFGMNVYAVGGNPLAATIAGIKTRRVTTAVYCLSGALAGIAGVVLASRVTAGIATTGTGYELDSIAAVVIGGISLVGGRGRIAGAMVGVLIIETLNNGLDILNVSSFYQDIIKGALIIAAVFVDVRVAKRDS
ncbi:MAG TPA: ABC transporter permease [Amycolatopsis sp.]|nr:ABC transporter permease [Amycolatopsis sp.]